MTFVEAKQYLHDVKAKRISNFLSFLGGEPLLHPSLNRIIKYGADLGFKIGVYTNGLLFTETKLREFEDLNVTYVMINVSKHQGRGDTEEEVNKIRDHFCEMFRGSKVILGFSFLIKESDVPDLDKIVGFFKNNADVVKYVNYSLYSPSILAFDAKKSHVTETMEERLAEEIRQAYPLTWASYLPSKYNPDHPGKISAGVYIQNGEVLRCATPEEARESSQSYFKKYGKHIYTGADPLTDDGQIVVISFSPMKYKQGLNNCKICHEQILFRGLLVPMCTLEWVVQRWGKLLSLGGKS